MFIQKLSTNILLTILSLKFIQTTNVCDSPIYCDGKILHAVQISNYFKDSKTFVDMPTRLSLDEVVANFNNIKNLSNNDELGMFLKNNFYDAGKDTVKADPTDWIAQPAYLSKIVDSNLAKFAKDLNARWKDLLRKFDPNQICQNCKTSAILTKNPFVVPGGRFIEYYYWDSYWIIESLLISEMNQTAKNMIQNFLDIVADNGFVPNGARIYYLNRSQPPLLIHMVDAYMNKTKDLNTFMSFLNASIDLMDLEYSFWMTQKYVNYTKNGKTYRLNKYNVKNTSPRPESYREDYENGRLSMNQTAYYSNVASSAESGWDFSSRWFVDPQNIKTITITDIIPVDLNSIMYKNEALLNKFYNLLGNQQKASFYLSAMKQREEAINSVLWNDELGTWGDLNTNTKY